MRGRRRRLNKVKEVKITAGSRVCPVAEYVTKAMTDASIGMLIATALLADRMRSSERIYLKKFQYHQDSNLKTPTPSLFS